MKTKAKKTKLHFQNLPKDYAGLVALLTPRPIHDLVDYNNVTEITDAMVLWDKDFTPDQADYFEALCVFIEKYDEEHVKWPGKPPTGLDCLRHLLEENKMSAGDLARLLGVHRSLGGMILRGERQLTVGHIKLLAKRFCVSGALFL